MGKASSAKKVARAARAGGIKRSTRPRLAFPLAIVAVLVLGGATVVYARTSHDSLANSDTKPTYKTDDHWHAAYGFWNCDKWVPALQDVEGKDDVLGIHTHGDGVIHVHPFKASASGERARLKTWGPMVGVEFFDDGWKLPDGTEFRQGSAMCGDKPAKVKVFRWKVDEGRAPAEVFDSGFADIWLSADRTAYTFAVMPQDAPDPAPKPESIPQLDQLTDLEGGAGGAGGVPGGAGGLSGLPGGAESIPVPGGAGGSPEAPSSPASPTP